MRRYIKADITTPKGAPRINYPEGWYENVDKILVRTYDDENKMCLAELDDDDVFTAFMATGRVEEITEAEMEAEVTRLRPPIAEVMITLTGEGKSHRTVIENLVKARGLTYRVEER